MKTLETNGGVRFEQRPLVVGRNSVAFFCVVVSLAGLASLSEGRAPKPVEFEIEPALKIKFEVSSGKKYSVQKTLDFESWEDAAQTGFVDGGEVDVFFTMEGKGAFYRLVEVDSFTGFAPVTLTGTVLKLNDGDAVRTFHLLSEGEAVETGHDLHIPVSYRYFRIGENTATLMLDVDERQRIVVRLQFGFEGAGTFQCHEFLGDLLQDGEGGAFSLHEAGNAAVWEDPANELQLHAMVMADDSGSRVINFVGHGFAIETNEGRERIASTSSRQTGERTMEVDISFSEEDRDRYFLEFLDAKLGKFTREEIRGGDIQDIDQGAFSSKLYERR